jgi:hypothetical protein
MIQETQPQGADPKRIEAALRKAHAAGDTEGAKKLAAAYKQAMSSSPPFPSAPPAVGEEGLGGPAVSRVPSINGYAPQPRHLETGGLRPFKGAEEATERAPQMMPPPPMGGVVGGNDDFGDGVVIAGSPSPQEVNEPILRKKAADLEAAKATVFRSYHQMQREEKELLAEFNELAQQRSEFNGQPGVQRGIDKRMDEVSARAVKLGEMNKSRSVTVNRELDSVIDNITKDGVDDLVMDKNGTLVADPLEVMVRARKFSEKYGVEDEDFTKSFYEKLMAQVDAKALEPEATNIFEEKAKDVLEKAGTKLWDGFTTDDVEFAKADSTLKVISNTLVSKANDDVAQVSASSKEVGNALNRDWEQISSSYKSKGDQIDQAFRSGAITPEDANARIQELNAWYEDQREVYSGDIDKLNNSMTSEINAINTRTNRAYAEEHRRIIEQANEIVASAAKKHAKQFGEGPEGVALTNKLKEINRAAWKKAIDNKNAKIKGDASDSFVYDAIHGGLVNAAGMRFSEATVTSLGGAIKGLSTTVGSEDGFLLGSIMERAYLLPEAKSESISDLFDVANFSQLSGQLLGGMAPSLVAASTAAAITSGAGAPAGISMLLSSAAGWGAETADIAGRTHDQVLSKTGDSGKADEAAWKSFKSQVQLMPAYAFEGLPFVSGALRFIPSKAGRIATGGALEFGTEMFQEIPQNIAEHNIVNGRDPWEGFAEALSAPSRPGGEKWGMVKSTLIGMAPITLLGGGGQIRSTSAQQDLEKSVKSYMAKADVGQYVNDAPAQWIASMSNAQGTNFSAAVIASLYTSGNISEAQAIKLDMMRLENDQYVTQSQSVGLNEREAKVFAAFSSKASDMRRLAEQENESPVMKSFYEGRAKELEKSTADFLAGKEAQYVTIEYPDGSSIVLDELQAKRMFADPSFAARAALVGMDKEGIQVSGNGASAATLVDEFQVRVLAAADYAASTALDPSGAQLTAIELREGMESSAERYDTEAEVSEESTSPEVRDAIIAARNELGIKTDPLSDLPDAVVMTFNRVEDDTPVSVTAIDEASDWMYKKYKQISAMRNDPKRMLTTQQIDSYLSQLEEDINLLEGHKQKLRDESENGKAIKQVTGEASQKPAGAPTAVTNPKAAPKEQVTTTKDDRAEQPSEAGKLEDKGRVGATPAPTSKVQGEEGVQPAAAKPAAAKPAAAKPVAKKEAPSPGEGEGTTKSPYHSTSGKKYGGFSVTYDPEIGKMKTTMLGTPPPSGAEKFPAGSKERAKKSSNRIKAIRKARQEAEDELARKLGIAKDGRFKRGGNALENREEEKERRAAISKKADKLDEDALGIYGVVLRAMADGDMKITPESIAKYLGWGGGRNDGAMAERRKTEEETKASWTLDDGGEHINNAAHGMMEGSTMKDADGDPMDGWSEADFAEAIAQVASGYTSSQEAYVQLERMADDLTEATLSPEDAITAHENAILNGLMEDADVEGNLDAAQASILNMSEAQLEAQYQDYLNTQRDENQEDTDGNDNQGAADSALGEQDDSGEEGASTATEEDQDLADRISKLADDLDAPMAQHQSPERTTLETGKLRTDRVAAALKKLVPNLEIIAPKTKEEYAETTKGISEGLGSTWGIYDPRTNKIYVNPSGPDLKQTLGHEGAHPLLLALYNSDRARWLQFFEEVSQLGGGVYWNRANEHYKGRDINERIDETVVEFLGDVFSGRIKVSTKPDSIWQKFKDFIKDILAALGWDMRSIDLSKPTDVREFAAQMKKAFDKGIAIEGFAPLEGSGQAMMQADQAFDGPETPKTPIGDTKTVTVDGKERTVFNSNGKPIHPTVEGVRNFWRWFGDSKVVDEQGRPLVVYHGSQNYVLNSDYEQAYIDLHRTLFPDEKPFMEGDLGYKSADYDRFWKFVNFYENNKHRLSEEVKSKIPKSLLDRLSIGLKKPFEIFDPSMAGSSTGAYDARIGFFFTPDRDFASRFTYRIERDSLTGIEKEYRSGLPHIKEVYLKSTKPVNLHSPKKADVEQWISDGIFPESWGTSSEQLAGVRSHLGSKDYQKFLAGRKDVAVANGYDGVRNKIKYDGRVREEIIVFSPTQIKSATGNYGTFDPNNPSILAQRPYGPMPTDTHKGALNAVAASVRAGEGLSKAITKGLNEVRKSDWYKALDATQQAQAEADFKAPIKALATPVDKKPSTAPKKLQKQVMEAAGKKPAPKITVNEVSALKDQIRMEARAAREAKGDIRAKQKAFATGVKDAISSLEESLSPAKTKVLLNKALGLNVENETSIERFLSYIDDTLRKSEEVSIDREVKRVVDMTDPSRFSTLRSSGIRKGKISNEQRKLLSQIHNAVKKMTPGDIGDRILQIDSELQADDANVSSLEVELEALRIAMLAQNGTMDGALAAQEAVKQIIEDGRSTHKEDLSKRAEKYRKNASIAFSAFSSGKGIKAGFERVANLASSRSFMRRTFGAIESFLDAGEGLRTLLDKFDRGERKKGSAYGKASDMLYGMVAKSRSAYDKAKREWVDRISSDMLNIYGSKKAVRKAMNTNMVPKKVGEFTDLYGKEVEMVLSQGQAMYVYNQMKDPSNSERFSAVTDDGMGMGWTDEMQEAVVDYLTPENKAWADHMVDKLYPAMYKEVNPVFKNLNYLDLPDNPLYSPRRVLGFDAGEGTILGGFSADAMGVSYNFLKERKKSNLPLDLDTDANSVLVQHMLNATHYVAFAETVRDLSAVLKDRTIKEAILQNNTRDSYKYAMGFVERLAKVGAYNQAGFNVLDKLRGNMSVSKLAVAPVIFFKQLLSAPAYLADMSSAAWVKEFGMLMASPASAIRASKKLMESEYMKARYKGGFDTEMMVLMSKDYKQLLSGSKSLKDHLMFMTKWGDKGAIIYGGFPVYEHYRKAGLKSGMSRAESEAFGMERFEEATKMSQQSSNTEDLSHFQSANPLVRLFTSFKTSPIAYFRQERKAVRDFERATRRGDKAMALNATKRFMIYHFVLPMLFQYVSNGLPGLLADWDDEDEEDMKRAALLGNINALFIFGDIIQWAGERLADKPWTRSTDSATSLPALDPLASFLGAATDLLKAWKDPNKMEEDVVEALMDLTTSAADFAGLPATRVEKMFKNYQSIMDDDKELTDEQKVMLGVGFSETVAGVNDKKKTKNKYEQEVSDQREASKERTEKASDIVARYEAGELTKEQSNREFEKAFKGLPVDEYNKAVRTFLEKRRYADAPDNVKEVLDINSVPVRVKMVRDMRSTMNAAEKKAFDSELRKANVMTDSFLKEYKSVKK